MCPEEVSTTVTFHRMRAKLTVCSKNCNGRVARQSPKSGFRREVLQNFKTVGCYVMNVTHVDALGRVITVDGPLLSHPTRTDRFGVCQYSSTGVCMHAYACTGTCTHICTSPCAHGLQARTNARGMRHGAQRRLRCHMHGLTRAHAARGAAPAGRDPPPASLGPRPSLLSAAAALLAA